MMLKDRNATKSILWTLKYSKLSGADSPRPFYIKHANRVLLVKVLHMQQTDGSPILQILHMPLHSSIIFLQ